MTQPDPAHQIQTHYTALAARYETRWRGFLAAVRCWVRDHLPEKPPQSILDFGCGTGVMLRMLGAHYPDAALYGVDIAPAMRQMARKNAPRAIITDHAGQTGQTRKYDLILSLNVLHHLDDAMAHLTFLREQCAENGHIILCDFAIDTPPMAAAEYLYWRPFHPVHRRAFSSKALQKLITKRDLHIDKHTILRPNYFWRLQIYTLRPS